MGWEVWEWVQVGEAEVGAVHLELVEWVAVAVEEEATEVGDHLVEDKARIARYSTAKFKILV